MKFVKLQLYILVLFLLISAPAQAATVRLSAAASLKETLNEIAQAFGRTSPGVSIVKNFGGSGSLAQQLQNGAPVDLFISANAVWMDYLKQRNLVVATSVADFTYNTLVFVGPAQTRATSLVDLLKLEKIAIGSPKSVPAGEYAIEAFKKAYIDKQLARKLVLAKDVRECLMYAERGEVDGAFVYRTDALQARKSRVLFTVPDTLYGRVTYSMALTVAGAKNGYARAFYRYLQGAEAKAILAKNGFAVR